MERPHEIDSFEEYLDRGEVKKSSRDPGRSQSLEQRSLSKFKVIEELGISENTATDYFENIYDCIRMLIQSFMAEEGYKPYNHEAIIAYSIDRLEIDLVEANTFNRYRKLRNDLVYRGEKATVNEAKDIRRLYLDLKSSLPD